MEALFDDLDGARVGLPPGIHASAGPHSPSQFPFQTVPSCTEVSIDNKVLPTRKKKTAATARPSTTWKARMSAAQKLSMLTSRAVILRRHAAQMSRSSCSVMHSRQ